VHAWDWTTPIDELMRGLDDLVRAGKVLYVGISDAPAWIVSHANALASLRGLSRFCAIQIEYSLLERTVERELLPMANYFGLGVLAWSPLAMGVLTGKYTREGDRDTQREMMTASRINERSLAIARTVDAVADELGRTSAQVAIAWILSRKGQNIPILGARKLSQLEDTLAASEIRLPPEALVKLDEVSRVSLGFPNEFLGMPFIRNVVYGPTGERLAVYDPVREVAGR
jgi:aryl-alcohol dehydrogenase-like predicted oxidoreductase